MNQTPLNLLTRNGQTATPVRFTIGFWLVINFIALAVVGYAWNFKQARKSEIEQQLHAKQTEVKRLSILQNDLSRMETQLVELDSNRQVADRIELRQPMLTLLSFISSAAEQCDSAIQIETMELRSKPLIGQDPLDPGYNVTLSGISVDKVRLSRFTNLLNRTSSFEQVKLLSSNNASRHGKPVLAYRIQCSF